uniref:Uncharacterized protein n=1 Tax=Eutreptiella gymnastica TaxID=73025 RepID=A0A7S4C7H5_9EUGL
MMPRAWYLYDEKNQEIKKKALREVSIVSIKRDFSRMEGADRSGGRASHDILAQYMYSSGLTDDGEEILTVEFMSQAELDIFLTKREKKGASMLQKFIAPKGPCNGSIQAIWSPHIFHCERRHNLHKLNDPRYSRFERAVTYEGPFYYSQQAFCAPKLERQVRQICDGVVNHVLETERRCISRMVLYFKVDEADQVWLQWSNCLRLHDKQSHNNVRLNLAQLFSAPQVESSIGKTKDGPKVQSTQDAVVNTPNTPARLDEHGAPRKVPQMPLHLPLCPNCSAQLDKDDRYLLSVENIVRYFNYQRRILAKRQKAKEEKDKMLSPHTITLFDSNDPKIGVQASAARSEGDDSADPYRNILMKAAATNCVSPALVAREQQMLAQLFQQMDNVLYEAYSHFQISRRPFYFRLQVNLSLKSQLTVIETIQQIPNCEQMECPAAQETASPRPSKDAPDSDGGTASPGSASPVLNTLARMLAKVPPPDSPGRAAEGGERCSNLKAPEENAKQSYSADEFENEGADSPAETHWRQKHRRRKRQQQQNDEYSDDEDFQSDNSADSFGSSSFDGSTSSIRSNHKDRASKDKPGDVHDSSSPPEVSVDLNQDATALTSTYFVIRWSADLSMLNLQKHFSAAKTAAELSVGVCASSQLYNRLATTPANTISQNRVATNASKAPPQRGPVTPRPGPHARSDDRTGDAEMRGTSTVPPVLLAVVPWLTDAEYAIWVSDARFVDQHVPLCQSCFLICSDVSSRELHKYRTPRSKAGVKSKVEHVLRKPKKPQSPQSPSPSSPFSGISIPVPKPAPKKSCKKKRTPGFATGFSSLLPA